jgi:hypothetical protein
MISYNGLKGLKAEAFSSLKLQNVGKVMLEK